MKSIVEWGRPKQATKRQICGMSGQFVVPNQTQARQLASQLFHTLTEGSDMGKTDKNSWTVSKDNPRKVVWSSDNTAWVAVSLLDGVARGPYVALADAAARNQSGSLTANNA